MVEHRDAIRHVVEGDPQLRLTLADLVEQSGVLDRDHRLVGEGPYQLELLVGVGLDPQPGQCDNAYGLTIAQQRGSHC